MKSLLFALFIGLTLFSQAGTITVQNTNNAGTGSLRVAIIISTAEDVICFNPTLITSRNNSDSIFTIDFGRNTNKNLDNTAIDAIGKTIK